METGAPLPDVAAPGPTGRRACVVAAAASPVSNADNKNRIQSIRDRGRATEMKRTVLAAAVMLAGIGTAQAAGTTLNVGIATADAGKLDPHLATTTPDKGVLHWMYNGDRKSTRLNSSH